MNFPKMILFDYGGTLCVEEAPFDGLRGTQALLEQASANPDQISAEEVLAFAEYLNQLIGRYDPATDDDDLQLTEVTNESFQRFLYEYLNISFTMNPVEKATLFWDSASHTRPAPYSRELLAFLQAQGIRSGVISNISFSGAVLEQKLNRLFPENHFEFVLASSDYVFRKPHPLIFELALRKADLQAEEVWYCGNTVTYDVYGAYGSGLYPVWYCPEAGPGLEKPDCEHLAIKNWRELEEVLLKLKN